MQQWNNASAPIQNAFGTFSYDPSQNIASLIFTNAGSASTRDQLQHGMVALKFILRMTILASSITADLTASAHQLVWFPTPSRLSFQYQEGYDTEIKCNYNSSTDYRLDMVPYSTSGTIP